VGKGRLEAFSDGVIAVIITIMVLEMKAPHGAEISDLMPLLPTFLTYIMSFIFVGIYWVNHHHFLHIIKKVSGGLLWANNHLLFWLSLIPFTTAWMGDNHFSTWPVFVYALNLVGCAVAYTICTIVVLRLEGPDSAVGKAIGADKKGKISLALYLASVPIALYAPLVSCGLFAVVSLMWLVPDRRIENMLR
jgi:uncharacterized membrane protein